MAITIGRTAWIDDDGTGGTGTVINNAEKTTIYNQIDTALASLEGLAVPAAWTTPAYNAADFTAQGAMTWTVDAGDVITFAYTISGKRMTVAFLFATTTIGGTPSFRLRFKIPSAKVAAKTTVNPVWVSNNGVALAGGYAQVDPAGTTIDIYLLAQGNFAAGTNNNYIYGQITFEIN
jgi:hypothetical protein